MGLDWITNDCSPGYLTNYSQNIDDLEFDLMGRKVTAAVAPRIGRRGLGHEHVTHDMMLFVYTKKQQP